MSKQEAHNWIQANQRYLVAVLSATRYRLERYLAKLQASPETETQEQKGGWQAIQQALTAAAEAMPAPSNLERLCLLFDLSLFEREILLLCAGMELEGQIAALCTAIQRHLSQTVEQGAATIYPTFSLVLAAFPAAHWNALTPTAPLRYWNLVETGSDTLLTLSPLHIDECILHYLVGVTYPDARLAHLLSEVAPTTLDDLVPTQRKLAEQIAATWRKERATNHPLRTAKHTLVQLCGEDVSGKHAIAVAACDVLNLQPHLMYVHMLPTQPTELATVVRLWERTALLNNAVLLLDCTAFDAAESARAAALHQVLQQIYTPLIITSRERFALPGLTRPMLSFDVAKPSVSEQHALWRSSLKPFELNGQIDQLVAQFHLSTDTIYATTSSVLSIAEALGEQDMLGTQLWDACRRQARPPLDELAQRIDPRADWDTLVLPETQLELLREIVAQVRQRTKVYERWNFRPGGSRGLGISALFTGASGTGKTLAAEVIAHTLRLDLYRIDLSAVVSKYIGETEKNLRRIFDAAAEGGVVLLFDEADALFGKRSEIKDSHDRYANIEVSYLLQRMEEYRGLAILTTNFKSALDVAFMRRLRFVVQFPFPDVTQRAEIWRRIFPPTLPTENLDFQKLARLNIAGGNIRNIALNAAFLAAEAGEAVQMKHLLRAAGVEYSKIEKPLTTAETGGWLCH